MEEEFKQVCNKVYEGENWDIMKDYINKYYVNKKEVEKIKVDNHSMKEQLENFIPRRRVRRIYKLLGNILDFNSNTDNYVNTLKIFINKIEKEGKAEADQEIKTAIEHLLSVRER